MRTAYVNRSACCRIRARWPPTDSESACYRPHSASPFSISDKRRTWVNVDGVGRRWRRSSKQRLTGVGSSPRVSAVRLHASHEFKVVQRTAEGVGVGRTWPANDEVDGARGARVALAADVKLTGRADRLGVGRRRLGRQDDQGGRDGDQHAARTPDTVAFQRRRRRNVRLAAAAIDRWRHCRRHRSVELLPLQSSDVTGVVSNETKSLFDDTSALPTTQIRKCNRRSVFNSVSYNHNKTRNKTSFRETSLF